MKTKEQRRSQELDDITAVSDVYLNLFAKKGGKMPSYRKIGWKRMSEEHIRVNLHPSALLKKNSSIFFPKQYLR